MQVYYFWLGSSIFISNLKFISIICYIWNFTNFRIQQTSRAVRHNNVDCIAINNLWGERSLGIGECSIHLWSGMTTPSDWPLRVFFMRPTTWDEISMDRPGELHRKTHTLTRSQPGYVLWNNAITRWIIHEARAHAVRWTRCCRAHCCSLGCIVLAARRPHGAMSRASEADYNCCLAGG